MSNIKNRTFDSIRRRESVYLRFVLKEFTAENPIRLRMNIDNFSEKCSPFHNLRQTVHINTYSLGKTTSADNGLLYDVIRLMTAIRLCPLTVDSINRIKADSLPNDGLLARWLVRFITLFN